MRRGRVKVQITRKVLYLPRPRELDPSPQHRLHEAPLARSRQKATFTVLVINSGVEMAQGITAQLTQAIPFSNILYAPTLELARWLLAKRSIHLVISSAILPDGSITELRAALTKSPEQPDVIVVGEMSHYATQSLRASGYRLASHQTIRDHLPMISRPAPPRVQEPVKPEPANDDQDSIKSLGAALRNDLNNPLQEIVAMVFVAKAGAATHDHTGQALEAINKAARGMANVIGAIEERIRQAVEA